MVDVYLAALAIFSPPGDGALNAAVDAIAAVAVLGLELGPIALGTGPILLPGAFGQEEKHGGRDLRQKPPPIKDRSLFPG
jgi:hypothetical protein